MSIPGIPLVIEDLPKDCLATILSYVGDLSPSQVSRNFQFANELAQKMIWRKCMAGNNGVIQSNDQLTRYCQILGIPQSTSSIAASKQFNMLYTTLLKRLKEADPIAYFILRMDVKRNPLDPSFYANFPNIQEAEATFERDRLTFHVVRAHAIHLARIAAPAYAFCILHQLVSYYMKYQEHMKRTAKRLRFQADMYGPSCASALRWSREMDEKMFNIYDKPTVFGGGVVHAVVGLYSIVYHIIENLNNPAATRRETITQIVAGSLAITGLAFSGYLVSELASKLIVKIVKAVSK